jgi:hypothetical protein
MTGDGSDSTVAASRPVTLTLTERDLHIVCNAADHAAFLWKYGQNRREDTAAEVGRVTEAMRVAWVEQVTA